MTTVVATSRYEYLLAQTRDSLSNLLTEDEWNELLCCFSQDFLYIEPLVDLASELHRLATFADLAESLGPLVEKLKGLSILQNAAIVETLEHVKYFKRLRRISTLEALTLAKITVA